MIASTEVECLDFVAVDYLIAFDTRALFWKLKKRVKEFY